MSDKKEELSRFIDQLCHAGLAGKYGEKSKKEHVDIWVRDGFHCVYCGVYLLADRIRLASAQLDHLLPRRYQEFSGFSDNLVLSCYCCNQIKHQFDPWAHLEIPGKKNNITRENFHEYRDSLIETCQKYLTGKLEAKDKIIDNSIAIIRNQYRLNSTLI